MRLFVAVTATLLCSAAASAIINKGSEPITLPTPITINTNLQKSAQQPIMALSEDWVTIGTGRLEDEVFVGGVEYEVTIQESVSNPGYYRIPDAWYGAGYETALPLYIDATNPDYVIIPYQDTGVYWSSSMANVHIASWSYAYSYFGYTADEVILNDPTAVIKFNGVCINIPAEALIYSFDTLFSADMQAYVLNDVEMNIYFPDAPDEWTTYSEDCTWTDGILASFYGYEPQEVTVTVEQNNYKSGYYRIVDPYQANVSGANALEIDLSIPACVMVPLQDTGMDDDTYGEMYILSQSYNMIGTGDGQCTVEEFLRDLAPYNAWATTTEDITTVTIPGPAIAYYFPSYSSTNIYMAPYEVASVLKMPAISTGISSIVSDEDTSAPAVYYNLQGVEIKTPQAGQLYIRKQGSRAEKIKY
ncbi:MAG: hypothetical protein LIO90_09935 [Bacteroidales bacterium]|nr:hypothetical protein [Bacteroidales bacterium]